MAFLFVAYRTSMSILSNQNEQGSTIVEFAIVSAFLLGFAITGADFLRLSYQNLTLQFMATQWMRTAVIGPTSTGSTEAQLESNRAVEIVRHTQAVRNGIKASALRLGVSLSDEQLRICPESDPSCLWGASSTGDGGELLMIHIELPMRVLLFEPRGVFARFFSIDAAVVGRNEFF